MLLKLLKTNNNILIVAFLVLIINQPTISQETTLLKGTINVGFESGIQFTGISDPYTPISENGIGYAAGAFIDYFLTEEIKIRGGLYYDNRAFSLTDYGMISDTGYRGLSSYYDITQKYKVNYLTIPISLIYIKGSDKFKFFLQGTLYYSMFLSSSQSGDFHIHISEEDAPHFNIPGYPEFNIPGDHYLKVEDDQFSTNDIGINALIGIVYFVKPNFGISFSPGFSYSFANVWEDPLRRTTWTRLYKVNLGIIYTLKQK
ncbi:MAG: outer membrane beta-barrel protein [Bacteroidota bacterium]